MMVGDVGVLVLALVGFNADGDEDEKAARFWLALRKARAALPHLLARLGYLSEHFGIKIDPGRPRLAVCALHSRCTAWTSPSPFYTFLLGH